MMQEYNHSNLAVGQVTLTVPPPASKIGAGATIAETSWELA